MPHRGGPHRLPVVRPICLALHVTWRFPSRVSESSDDCDSAPAWVTGLTQSPVAFCGESTSPRLQTYDEDVASSVKLMIKTPLFYQNVPSFVQNNRPTTSSPATRRTKSHFSFAADIHPHFATTLQKSSILRLGFVPSGSSLTTNQWP